jgi:AAA+ ATPase superfamily predicted ATPase
VSAFFGRAAELQVLERAYAAAGSAFVPVYGRRRIGKTELLRHFAERHRAIFHVGKTAPAGLQIREFLDEAARVLDEPLLAELASPSWDKALSAVVSRWKGPGKLVLVFDEFQWSAGASPELPSVLQAAWDKSWKRRQDVLLVLCGSFIGFMEREVLGAKSPLFGRRTAQIHLQPFSFPEARLFHPRASIEQQALTYFLTGGVAQYLTTFDAQRSFRQNVEQTLFDEFAPLGREPEFLLREELRDVASFSAVLMAIAGGAGSAREIAAQAGVPERSLHYYLEQLVELGHVARRYPLTGAPPRRTQVRFVLDDALLRFWFRFVFPHKSFVTQRGAAQAYATFVAPQLDAWAGQGFERLCRASLAALLAREGVSAGVEVGQYWDPSVQIDVVGLRDDGITELGECKWGKIGGRELQRQLTAKLAHYPNAANHTLRAHAFVKSWRGKPPAGLTLHTLEALG